MTDPLYNFIYINNYIEHIYFKNQQCMAGDPYREGHEKCNELEYQIHSEFIYNPSKNQLHHPMTGIKKG